MDKIITRILNELVEPDLLTILAQNLNPTDRQSLFLQLYSDVVAESTPAQLLNQYKTSRFLKLARITPQRLAEFETLAFKLLPDNFESVILSPLAPLGSCSASGGVDQNNVVSTIRNNEVCADSTITLALESALRRKQAKGNALVKLASSQRVVRAQRFDNPALSAHFQLLCLSTAGKMAANSESLINALREHIDYYLRLFQAVEKIDAKVEDFSVGIAVINNSLKERVNESVIKQLMAEHSPLEIGFDQQRDVASGYYKDLALSFYCKPPKSNRYIRLIDGGNTDWTQKLLSNSNEFFFNSAIGIELFLNAFSANISMSVNQGGK